MESMDELMAKAIAADAAAIKALPCTGMADRPGSLACSAARAFETCNWLDVRDVCPRARIDLAYGMAMDRMQRGGVEAREHELIAADLQRRKRVPLDDTAALRVVRAVLSGNGESVPLSPPVAVRKREVLIALGGPRGVGKTVAACYAIAVKGGRYLTAYQFARPGLDIDEIKALSGVVVIDQLGRENVGQSAFGLASLEEVIDSRYAGMRTTILCANMTREQFEPRYQGILADRLSGGGLWVSLTGKSLRGAK